MPDNQTRDFKILLDVPVQSDLALNFDALSAAFREVIEHSDPQFAIGLFGGWGSGKTTLMRAIEAGLPQNTCATVWFSAWRYEKEDHLIVPLLDVIREALVVYADRHRTSAKKASRSAMKVASTIGQAISSLMAGFSVKLGVPGGPDLSFDANKALSDAKARDAADEAARVPRSFYHASFSAMRDAFAEFTQDGARRIVVFVDDLDRCLPEGALEVLESMKLFFDLKGFVFVVGLDREIVEMSVEKRYREMLPKDTPLAGTPVTGANYLRKIFQVPYGLAPIAAGQIDDFLRNIEQTADLPARQWAEIDTIVRPHLQYLIKDQGVNPREVKRYINSYTLVRKITPHLDANIVLAMQTLDFRPDWRDIQTALLAYRDGFVDALGLLAGAPGSGVLEQFIPTLAHPPTSFVAYIGATGPGNALASLDTKTQTIDDFIYSGTATRSTDGSAIVEFFGTLGGALGELRIARTTRAPSAGVLGFCHTMQGRLSVMDPTGGGRFAGVIQPLNQLIEDIQLSDWDIVINEAPGAVPDPAERLGALADDWTQRLRAMMTALQELYRAGLA